MQPENIQGAQYTVKLDVWLLGVSLIRLMLGQFPFSEDQTLDDSDLEDLQGTLSLSGLLFDTSVGQKQLKEDKERKQKSIGVSL